MALTKINSAGLNINADTASGDDAAVGYTSAEGLIITGQGSTSDVTLKNDADGTVFTVPTGTDDILFPDSAKGMWGAGSDMQLYHDGSNSYITNAVGALKIATETSGIALTIGHTTSETTVADNLTVTGDLAVTGTLDHGWVKIAQNNLSGAASTVTFTSGIDGTYGTYLITCENVQVATDNTQFNMQFYIGGSLADGSVYQYHHHSSHSGNGNYEAQNETQASPATQIQLMNSRGNGAGEGACGQILIIAPSDTDMFAQAHWKLSGGRDDASVNTGDGIAMYTAGVEALTGVLFKCGSGNIADGTFTLYGLAN